MDDTCSYLIKLERIKDIIICDETLRLIEARRRYKVGLETDVRHHMRKRGVIMKVGSRWRKEGSSSWGGILFGAGLSC